MKFEKTIIIDETEYTLIDIQRSGSAIYKSDSNYLRMGETAKIQADLALHKQMERFDFPVAKLVGEGVYQGQAYFIEKSLGEMCFGQIFKNETESVGHITDQSFEKFLRVMIRYTQAQLRTISTVENWNDFRMGIHLDIILRELPEEKDRIMKRYQAAEKRLSVFPFGIQHGDLTPFNIYPDGIIDIEDSFLGPIGYDLGSFMQIQNWFPEKSEDEFYKSYKFTDDQQKQFIETVEKIYLEHGLPKILDHAEDFDFTKGIWFTVRMQELPKLQQFRYEIIKNLIK